MESAIPQIQVAQPLATEFRAAGSRSCRREALVGTPHPTWAEEMIERLRPAWRAVSECPLFTATRPGQLPEEWWRRVVCEFFCVVEAFPKYMGITLAKTTFGREPKDELARNWLIGNIRVEARHAEWFLDWAASLGVSREEMISHRPHSAVAGLDSWLWSVAYRGSLAEAVAAINYAIEGPTGEWTRLVLPAFQDSHGEDSLAMAWLVNHAEYDDKHPVQAFEIVKNALGGEHAEPRPVQQVEAAIRRSLELFRTGFDYCCDCY